jgi:alpha-glucosidase (family GH31 glycosyl hydrolase)
VVWAGDQRTSFDTDDGFPTVIPLGLGLAASGVPNAFAHDVGGYQSLGNDPSDKELWFRWAALGAYTPVMRTHHGAFADDNWQFDSDDETTEHWAAMGREHARLFPYLFGLAARASDDGVPMLLPPAFLYETEWGRMDAWLLGDALFVAPVLERGVDGRDVELPGGVDWYSWPDLAPAQSGWFDADLTEIPVFAAANTTVPTLAEAPDTLTAATADGVTDLDDVDGARVVYVFGDGGRFLEADGTLYLPRGAATGSGEGTATFESGELEVAGVTVEISGPRERTYTVVVTR